MKKAFIALVLLLFIIAPCVSAEKACAVYFTKIGCPVCASVDPVFLGEWIEDREDAVIIEYMFNSWYEENAVLMGEYNLSHATGGAVPLVIKSEELNWSGIPGFADDAYIYGMLEQTFPKGEENECLLLEKTSSFGDLDLNELPRKPKIWHGKRLLVKKGDGLVSSDFLKELLFSEDLAATLAGSDYVLAEVEAEPAPYSGGEIAFAQAIEVEGSWVLKLKDKIGLPENVLPLDPNNGNGSPGNGEANPFVVPIAVIVVCLVALVVFVKVKRK